MHDLAYGYPCPFQSTLSMRRATKREGAAVVHRHISIHALHEESDSCISHGYHTRAISIHALHEESDPQFIPVSALQLNFNPRSP